MRGRVGTRTVGGPKFRDVSPPAQNFAPFSPSAAGHGHGPPKLCIWVSLGGHFVRALALTRTSTSNRWLSQRSTVAATPDVGTTPSMFARSIEVEMFCVMTFRLRPNVREGRVWRVRSLDPGNEHTFFGRRGKRKWPRHVVITRITSTVNYESKPACQKSRSTSWEAGQKTICAPSARQFQEGRCHCPRDRAGEDGTPTEAPSLLHPLAQQRRN